MANTGRTSQFRNGKAARTAPSRAGGPAASQAVAPVEPPKAQVEPAPAPAVETVVADHPVETPQIEAAPAAVSETVLETPATGADLSLKKGPETMTDMIETGKAFAEDAKARIQSAVAELNEKAKAAMEKSTKTMEELGELTKGNLEALVESSKIAAKGVEAMGQDAAEYGRKSFEKTSATIKSFAAIKSPTEFFQLQSELMTSTFDTMAAEAAKTSEAMLKLAGEIAQPISSRVAVVSDKIKTLAA